MSVFETALEFVNTRLDRPGGPIDGLSDPDAVSGWVRDAAGFASIGTLSPTDAVAVVALRDAAHRLMRARVQGTAALRADLEAVNAAAEAAPRAERIGVDWVSGLDFVAGGRSEEPRTVTELLAALAGAVISLASDASLDLAECGADDCVVLFARTDPRQQWHCERCGNRVRAARNYARRKGAASSS